MLLYLCLLTILLSLVLLFYNRNSKSNTLFLALFFITSSSFGLAHYFVFQTKSLFWIALFFNHWVPFMFLIGPFLFFYVRGAITERSGLTKWDFVHFAPAILSGVGTIPYYLESFEVKKNIAKQLIYNVNSIRDIEVNLFYDAGESFVLRSVLCLVYLLYSIYLVFRYYKNEMSYSLKLSSQKLLVLRWLSILLGAILLIVTIFIGLAFNAAYVRISDSITEGYVYYIGTGVIYLIMALALLQFPNVLYGISRNPDAIATIEVKNNPINKSQDSFIENGSVTELGEKINTYLKEKKPYLDTFFSVSSIAIALGVSEDQISFCIKHYLNTNFIKLRTELRVNHAINLLQSEAKDRLTIEAIGKESGFKTRSNFYTAFKEETGFTPTEYIEQTNTEA